MSLSAKVSTFPSHNSKAILWRNQTVALALPAGMEMGMLENASCPGHTRLGVHMLGTILIIILILILLGALPRWPHSANWGYGPSGALGVVLVIVLILVLLGRI